VLQLPVTVETLTNVFRLLASAGSFPLQSFPAFVEPFKLKPGTVPGLRSITEGTLTPRRGAGLINIAPTARASHPSVNGESPIPGPQKRVTGGTRP
jgi:hypothetical protein